MKRSTILLLLCLSFSACRKDKPLFDGQSCNGNCYILTGKLTEAQTNSPLSNVKLKFYYRPAGYYIIFPPIKYLGTVSTAADGSYQFKFNSKGYEKPAGYFRIEGGKAGYIGGNMGDMVDKDLLIFDLDSTKINVTQTNDLKLYKSSILKIRVRASKIINFQFLTVNFRYGNNGYGPVLNGKTKIDTTLVYNTASDMPTYINWSATGNGINIQKRDTIVVASGTEKTYEIDL